MASLETYRFSIDVWTPATLPMGRLAAYLAELARLLGEPAAVHLQGVEEGSAILVAAIQFAAAPKVRTRLEHVRSGQGPADAMRAVKAIDNLLAEDNAVGTLTGADNVIYVEFVGRNRSKPVRYGPFKERGSLEGVLVKVGGIDRTVPVWIQDASAAHHCTASVELSKQLAKHYRTGTLRVHGIGKWSRLPDGTWQIEDFVIDDFEVLDEMSLEDVVKQLQTTKGGARGQMDDPLTHLQSLRSDGEVH